MHENGRMAERNYGKSNLVSFYISQKILSYAYLLLGYFGDFKSLYIKIIFWVLLISGEITVCIANCVSKWPRIQITVLSLHHVLVVIYICLRKWNNCCFNISMTTGKAQIISPSSSAVGTCLVPDCCSVSEPSKSPLPTCETNCRMTSAQLTTLTLSTRNWKLFFCLQSFMILILFSYISYYMLICVHVSCIVLECP